MLYFKIRRLLMEVLSVEVKEVKEMKIVILTEERQAVLGAAIAIALPNYLDSELWQLQKELGVEIIDATALGLTDIILCNSLEEARQLAQKIRETVGYGSLYP